MFLFVYEQHLQITEFVHPYVFHMSLTRPVVDAWYKKRKHFLSFWDKFRSLYFHKNRRTSTALHLIDVYPERLEPDTHLRFHMCLVNTLVPGRCGFIMKVYL